jgi:hypothetical protein
MGRLAPDKAEQLVIFAELLFQVSEWGPHCGGMCLRVKCRPPMWWELFTDEWLALTSRGCVRWRDVNAALSFSTGELLAVGIGVPCPTWCEGGQ